MVKEAIHDWAHHVGEDVLSNEVNWVLNDDNSEIDELVHEESNDWVVMVKVGFTEVDVSVIHNWVKISVLIQLQVSLEIKLEIFEDKLNIAEIREEPEVDLLFAIYFPMFDCWEFYTDQGFIKRPC